MQILLNCVLSIGPGTKKPMDQRTIGLYIGLIGLLDHFKRHPSVLSTATGRVRSGRCGQSGQGSVGVFPL